MEIVGGSFAALQQQANYADISWNTIVPLLVVAR
jgi:hypothetical protein